MRTEQLTYLIEIEKTHSFNAAAQNLHLTQQSLSNSVASLENEFSVKIFNRSYRGVTLTDEGKLILDTAKEMLKLYNTLIATLQAINQKNYSSNLTLCITPRTLNYIESSINNFKINYPDTTVEINKVDSISQILKNIESFQHFDLILISCYLKNNKLFNYTIPDNISFHPLSIVHMALAVNKRNTLAKKHYLQASQLKELSSIQIFLPDKLNTSQYEDLSLFFDMFGLKNCTFSDSIYHCLQGILDDIFPVLISSDIQKNLFMHPDITFVPIRSDLIFYVGYFQKNDSDLSNTAKLFLSFIDTTL